MRRATVAKMTSTVNTPTLPEPCATLYVSGDRQTLEAFVADYKHYLDRQGHQIPDGPIKATAFAGTEWRECTMSAKYPEPKTGRLVAQFFGHGFLREIPLTDLQGEAVPVCLAPRQRPASPAVSPKP